MIATSQHARYLAPISLWTLSLDDYKPSMVVDLSGKNTKDSLISQNIQNSNNTDSSIKVIEEKGDTFSAKIMLVPNPKRIKVAVTKYKGHVGQTLSEMVSDNHAVAGVNGGKFDDVGYRGTGGKPRGITIHDGQVITTKKGSQPIVGFDKNGLLVVGKYSEEQLTKMDVTEAVTFGPVLVKDGQGVVKGDGGWGAAPRTAIGQKEDGTIIMIVTDGRFVHGSNNFGATIKDVMNLMLKYGAVNAANLDGGSSTTMVKDGVLVNEPCDPLGERKIATSFIVLPN
jgi:exopolysaccharide biosynthesis protein